MVIGKPVPMLDAAARVAGTVPYAANLKLPDMLVVKVLRSLVPHGTILHLDLTAAEGLEGVAVVLSAADLDRPGAPVLLTGAFLKDQPVLARDRVRYVGEPIALVAAESAAVAEQALELIQVDYDELPAVYSVEEALRDGAPVLHELYPDNCFVHAGLSHGDLKAGFAAADEIVEETYTSPTAQQSSLEPHTAAAQWLDGRLTVWTASQAPYIVRRSLADLFGLDQGDVRVIVPPLGGGYGGKGHLRIEPLVAALAWKAGGRPVKLSLTRAEEFVTVTKHAAVIHIKTGVRRDGSLTARQVTLYWNAGAYADASPGLVKASVLRSLGPYRLPAARVDAYGVYTNLPPAAAFRGAMSSQTTWAYESHTDTLARRLGLDPLAFRLQNLLREGDTFASGERLHDVHFDECLEAAARGLGWGEPSPPVDERRPWLKRGRGLAVMIKSTIAVSRSQCRLALSADGLLTVFTSTVEMGQGAHTALAQIAADAVELPLESVRVAGPDTDTTPFDSTTSASRSTHMMGSALLAAAGELKRLLVEAAVPLFEQPPEALAAGQGAVYVRGEPQQRIPFSEILQRNRLPRLEAMGEAGTQAGAEAGPPHYHQGAGACEVEVDTQTGKIRVLRFCAASFAGRVVNPALARLQNDGNVIFGLGPALMEEMVFSGGQVTNPNFSDYPLPSFLDSPEILISESLEAQGSDFHGIGEMTLPPVAPAIANALFDAAGVRIRGLPLTPEKVLKALLEPLE